MKMEEKMHSFGRKLCEPRPRGRKAWRQEVQFGCSIMEEEAVRL